MTVQEMHNRARTLLALAMLLMVVGLVLVYGSLPGTGYALACGAVAAAMVGGHLHGAADERGRQR